MILDVSVLGAYPERQYALNTLKAGASGYLAKECAPDGLLSALRTVLQGRRYISSELAEILATDMDLDGDTPLHNRLSQREFQIFVKLASGITVSHIGSELAGVRQVLLSFAEESSSSICRIRRSMGECRRESHRYSPLPRTTRVARSSSSQMTLSGIPP